MRCFMSRRSIRFLPLLAVPLLLAPVRYQTGEGSILLAPSQGAASASYALPAAVGLRAPTVITLSPTVGAAGVSATGPGVVAKAASGTVVRAGAGAKQVVVVVAAEELMPSATAVVCMRALKMTAEMAVLSYQQKRQQATMNMAIAATLAAGEASERHYPLLTATREGLGKIASGTPQNNEITTAASMALMACANPGVRGRVAPGSRVPVPRPD